MSDSSNNPSAAENSAQEPMKKRKSPFPMCQYELQLIRACQEHFPWDKGHGEIGAHWELVAANVNAVANVPPGTNSCSTELASKTADRLLEKYGKSKRQERNSRSEEFNSGATGHMETQLNFEIAKIYDKYVRALGQKVREPLLCC